MIQSITPAGTTSYLVNAMGQRVYKSGAGYYAYDKGGRLVGEYNPDGSVIQEYVYIGGRLAAILRNSGVYYVYPDHLGAPRLVTDASGNVVWTWETEPFGTAAPNEDPNATGRTFTLNIRFPGQYYDKETNLHYNHFRYYDPTTGRYIESDPIGLGGGLNTYAYVGGNPLGQIDPTGEGPVNPEPWDHLIYPPQTNCSFTYDCMETWKPATNVCSVLVGLLPGSKPGMSQLCKSAVASICGDANESKCAGPKICPLK